MTNKKDDITPVIEKNIDPKKVDPSQVLGQQSLPIKETPAIKSIPEKTSKIIKKSTTKKKG